MKNIASKTGLETVVITFSPHPRQVIFPNDNSLELLNSDDEKRNLLEENGIDNLVFVPFTVAFSQLSADEYIEKFIVQHFAPKHIVIGYDHQFGLNRAGDIRHLNSVQEKYGFSVTEIKKEIIDEIVISSSKIRKAIQTGDITAANTLLGTEYPLSGKVIHGQKIGNTIGFPTANLKIENKFKLIPPNGVYAVTIKVGQSTHKGMMYIGNRPTLDDSDQRSIEINIFDFNQDIYNKDVSLKIISFIRESKPFDDLHSLKTQLHKDKLHVKQVLADVSQSTKPVEKVHVQKKVAVVILNYNGAKYLEDFLPSVIKHLPEYAQIYVGDNGSTDDSIQLLEEKFSDDIEIIKLPENYGFTGGYNKLLELIKLPYFLFLNSDVEIKSNWIEPLFKKMESSDKIAACQPKVLAQRNPDTFEHAGAAGGMMDVMGYPLCRGRFFTEVEKDTRQYEDDCQIFWATGAAMLVRYELVEKFGVLEDYYFAHHEEIDWCWRLKNAGYEIHYVADSVVYHVGGGTLDYNSPRKTYYNFRNSLINIIKNESSSRVIPVFIGRLFLDGLAGVLFLSKGQFGNIWAIVRAHWAVFLKLIFWIKRRKELQSINNKYAIGSPNTKGRLSNFLFWEFYIRKHKKYSDL